MNPVADMLRSPVALSRYDRAVELATKLGRRLELAAVPTIDGRVIVFAPRHRGDQVRLAVEEQVLSTGRTVRVDLNKDPRLAVVEVSGVSAA